MQPLLTLTEKSMAVCKTGSNYSPILKFSSVEVSNLENLQLAFEITFLSAIHNRAKPTFGLAGRHFVSGVD
jgi:hypothetical protein